MSCKKEEVIAKDSHSNVVTISEEGKIIPIENELFENETDSTIIKFYQKNRNQTFWMDFNCRE